MIKTVATNINLKQFKKIKIYSVCEKCGKSVWINKPLFGSLHFCNKTKAKLEYEKESKSHFEQQYCLSDSEIKDRLAAYLKYAHQIQCLSAEQFRSMKRVQQQQGFLRHLALEKAKQQSLIKNEKAFLTPTEK